MKGFCPLASGSKGNVLYLGTNRSKILIDAGISAKRTEEKLQEIGVSLEEIDAILITHEHIDHILGLKAIAERYQIPILANSDTVKGIYAVEDIDAPFKIFTTFEKFTFQDLEIFPFAVQHDTLDPVGFTLKFEGLKIGICTDLGFVTTTVEKSLAFLDYLYLEANHHVPMVHASSRPQVYKQRVLGRQGHLSNEDAAALLSKLYHPGLKGTYLAHLSSECNSEVVARKVVEEVLEKQAHKVSLSIAKQDVVSESWLF